MSVRRLRSGGRWEEAVGYSRVVQAGQLVFVAGCTGVLQDGRLVAGGAYEQAAQACRNVAAALEQAGASVRDVVQTRMYVTDIAQSEQVGRAHAEAFGGAPPAATMVEVSGLIDPRMVVEVEAVAFVP